jgi:phage terminase small subunit
MPDLTHKQRAFVAEYLVDLNAAQAAIRAGYSEKTARKIGQENLTKPDIQAAISKAFEARIERTEITADRVLLEYARIAFSEMRQFAEWGPGGVTWKDSENLSEEAAACVAEVSETISEGGRTRRFKLHSKTSALSDLAKHLGLFGKDGNAAGVNVNVNIDNRPKADLSKMTDEELEFYERLLSTPEEEA